MQVISILNQKGGVGKTSVCHHLAGSLAKLEARVLLLDNDPQSSLTQGLIGVNETLATHPSVTMAAILGDEMSLPWMLIRPSGVAGVDIVPGSRACTTFNVPDPDLVAFDRQTSIRDFLAQVQADYDFVLIDNPPNLHLCSWASLVASDFLIVPLQPENYGAQGIGDVTESMTRVQAGPNPGLKFAGYLLTMVAKEAIHHAFETMLRDAYGREVFNAKMPRATLYKEAIGALKPISLYRPRSVAARAMSEIALELIFRTGARGQAILREAS